MQTFPIAVTADVDGPRFTWISVGEIKRVLPLGLSLLIGFFYVAAFFAPHNAFEATVLVLLGLSVFTGLLEANSVRAAIPAVVFDDVVYVTLGALAVQLAIRTAGMTAVQAAAFVGVLASLSGRFNLLDQRVRPATLYCGAFVGMTASNVLPSLGWLTLAGILAGILYSLANHFWVGIGGKLGTMAFAGTAVTVGLARSAGLSHQNLTPASMNPAFQCVVVGVGIMCVPLTYWLSERRKFGPVFASAVPSATLAFGANLLDPSWQSMAIPLGTVWFGASFAGMTSVERLAGRHWILPLIGFIYALLSMHAGPRLYGFGGGLGTTALISVLAAFGIVRLFAGKPGRNPAF